MSSLRIGDKFSGNSTKIFKEDNDQMTGSYLIVNPHGKFYSQIDNGNDIFRYKCSESILVVGSEKAFGQIAESFSSDDFRKRYRELP